MELIENHTWEPTAYSFDDRALTATQSLKWEELKMFQRISTSILAFLLVTLITSEPLKADGIVESGHGSFIILVDHGPSFPEVEGVHFVWNAWEGERPNESFEYFLTQADGYRAIPQWHTMFPWAPYELQWCTVSSVVVFHDGIDFSSGSQIDITPYRGSCGSPLVIDNEAPFRHVNELPDGLDELEIGSAAFWIEHWEGMSVLVQNTGNDWFYYPILASGVIGAHCGYIDWNLETPEAEEFVSMECHIQN